MTTAPPRTTTIDFLTNGLARHGDATAIVTADERLTYGQLAQRVDRAAARLAGQRRLVQLIGANDLDVLVHYLAALSAGHVVLLVPPSGRDAVARCYDPDIVLEPSENGVRLDERREVSAHELHPELALLLSTSGSTGSAKLVRLSYENLAANAGSIADYLGLRPDDRGPTTLPISYCYGLSVVHSHLLVGAALLLTDESVLQDSFWQFFRRERGTSIAGVPYTFDLLARIGFEDLHLPHLRRVTSAGGRLAPDRVRELAELGRQRGWDLFVMYGQTEATARIAYLPPDLAAAHPAAVGVPVPGGSLRIEPVPEAPVGTGELVYSGPNVMLGYATCADDLGVGRVIDELRTGDLARVSAAGLCEIIGRRSRFAKVFGLRIDLERLEHDLADAGWTACCVDVEGSIVVTVEGTARPDETLAVLTGSSRLPARVFRLRSVPTMPRLENGKPDRVAIRDSSTDVPAPAPALPGATARPTQRDVVILFAAVLGRPDATAESTFVGLGGDSLSYVELSLRLEELLGRLPRQWHVTPIRDLAGLVEPRSPWLRTIETGLLLRAVGIVLIVGSHANVFDSIGKLEGAAHALIGVAGFNAARFCLTGGSTRARIRRLLVSTAYVALPSAAFIGVLELLGRDYPLANVFLLNSVLGSDVLGPPWQFWFLEALVQLMLLLAVVLCIPAVGRLQRRAPFGFAVAVFGLGLLPRFGLVDLDEGAERLQTAPGLVWLFGLGLAAAAASGTGRRLAVSLAAILTVPGFFGEPRREAIVLTALLLCIWVRTFLVPRGVHRVIGLLAANTLYIYVTHWQVFPHLQDDHPHLALLASLTVGIAYGMVIGPALRGASSLFSRVRGRQPLANPPDHALDVEGAGEAVIGARHG